MGLDMYLYGVKYNYHSRYDDEKWSDGEPKRSYQILEEVIYWRKANQIHYWFVKNVQDGDDDCAMYYVSLDNLNELKEICEKILDNNELANELLPTRSGFFFGSTDYDEFYFNDIKYTLDNLNELLKKDYDWYIYESSW